MKILICGDRLWNDREAIKRELQRFNPETDTLIEGLANGADILAWAVGKELGFTVKSYNFPQVYMEVSDSNGDVISSQRPEGNKE